jgi:hypothetical protein
MLLHVVLFAVCRPVEVLVSEKRGQPDIRIPNTHLALQLCPQIDKGWINNIILLFILSSRYEGSSVPSVRRNPTSGISVIVGSDADADADAKGTRRTRTHRLRTEASRTLAHGGMPVLGHSSRSDAG